MTDAMSKLIIENAILPEFRRGDFAAGITAGVRDIKDVLLGDAEAVKERATRRASNRPDPDTMQVILLALLARASCSTSSGPSIAPSLAAQQVGPCAAAAAHR